MTYMISVDNIIKFKNILSRDTCNLNHFDNDIVIITLNHIQNFTILYDEIHLINKEKYNHLKTDSHEYIKNLMRPLIISKCLNFLMIWIIPKIS